METASISVGNLSVFVGTSTVVEKTSRVLEVKASVSERNLIVFVETSSVVEKTSGVFEENSSVDGEI